MKVSDALIKEADKYAETHTDVKEAYIAGATRKRKYDLSFVCPEYKETFEEWLAYKGSTYKNQHSIELCYKNLLKLSNNSPLIAKAIVEQSIANGWKGLFELKNNARNTENKPSIIELARKFKAASLNQGSSNRT